MSVRDPRRHRFHLPDWLVTYGDMMSLLLVLFAFLFWLNTIRPARHHSLFSGYNGLGLPILLEVEFARGSSELRAGAEKDLAVLARRLSRSDLPLALVGYASPRVPAGPGATLPAAESIEELSLERARVVGARLEEFLGRDTPVLLLGGCGANHPGSSRWRDVPQQSPRRVRAPRDALDKVEVCLVATKVGRERS